jgi:hypothetical protein
MKWMAMVFALILAASFSQAKDHSAEYKVGTFMGTGQVSDGSYASCSGGGCAAYSAAHNIHSVSTEDGVYAIEAPTSVAGTVLVGMTTSAPTPTIHKAWFMDNLHDGDKVLFAAKCDMKHTHRCEFWLPDPNKPGKEISTMGGFSPAVAQTNTTSLCGMGKLSASVEAQVCGKAEPQAAVAPVAPAAPVVQPAVAQSLAPAVQPVAAKPAPAVQQTPACKSVMTDANGQQTCMD